MNQFYLPLERPQAQFGTQGTLLERPGAPAAGWTGNGGILPLRPGGDGISMSPTPPQQPFGGSIGNFMFDRLPGCGPLGALIQQLMNMLQQLMGMFSGSQGTPQPENFYNNATASSTGDPHLAFSGTQSNGQSRSARFDSMAGHQDLVDSDSFAGGYQVSTQVTTPNQQGVTMNQSATITTNNGGTQVSLDRSGNVSITADGQPVTIAPGQTLDLGGGQTVTQNNDGSLSVINVNGQGGTIDTVLKVSGGGVDVTTTAHEADLGGDILNQPGSPPVPVPVMYPFGARHPM